MHASELHLKGTQDQTMLIKDEEYKAEPDWLRVPIPSHQKSQRLEVTKMKDNKKKSIMKTNFAHIFTSRNRSNLLAYGEKTAEELDNIEVESVNSPHEDTPDRSYSRQKLNTSRDVDGVFNFSRELERNQDILSAKNTERRPSFNGMQF